MKYALLGYDLDATLGQLAPEDKRALHQGHAARGEGSLGDGIRLIAHYRFRPPALATTVRIGTEGAIRRQGPASEATATLRALYILESDDPEQAAQLAEQLPATLRGATIEIWPLSEPHASHQAPSREPQRARARGTSARPPRTLECRNRGRAGRRRGERQDTRRARPSQD